ncbi:MAG: tetratricopeptide repeat protein [Alphaproteobacteria bacterium]
MKSIKQIGFQKADSGFRLLSDDYDQQLDIKAAKDSITALSMIVRNFYGQSVHDAVLSSFQQKKDNFQTPQIISRKVSGPKVSYLTHFSYGLAALAVVACGIFFGVNQTLPIHSSMPLPAKQYLLMRPAVNKQISDIVKQQKGIKVVSLIGIGGAGKTTAARSYGKQQKSALTWEINAETRASLYNSIEALAIRLCDDPKQQMDIVALRDIQDHDQRLEVLLTFVRPQLKKRSDWVLIFDNIESLSDIPLYIPRDAEAWGTGTVLMTTRNANIENARYLPKGTSLKIGPLSNREKIELLESILGTENEFSADDLAALPPYPLDVSIAGHYLKEVKVSLAAYLQSIASPSKAFQEMQTEVLHHMGNYKATRFGILSLALERIVTQNPDFRVMLYALSLMDTQDISLRYLAPNDSQANVQKFIAQLRKYSLITAQGSFRDQQTICVHRSTQAAIRKFLDQSPPNDAERASYQQFLADTAYKINRQYDTKLYAWFVPHLQSAIKQTSDQDLQAVYGSIQEFLGHFEAAAHTLENALQSPEGLSSKMKVWAMVNLACVYCEQGLYKKAVQTLDHCLTSNDLKNNPEPEFYGHMGYVYKNCGEYDKARSCFDKSLELYDARGTPNAWTILVRGHISHEMGHYAEALKYYEKSLRVFQETGMNDNLQRTWALARSAKAMSKLGKIEQAEEYLKEASEICARNVSKKHLSFVFVYYNQGRVAFMKGDYEAAIKSAQLGINIYNFYQKADTVRHTRLLRLMANAYLAMGRVKEAYAPLQQSLQIFEKSGHPEIYATYEDLGDFYKADGQPAKSLEHLRLAYSKLVEAKPNAAPLIDRIRKKIESLDPIP